MMFQIILDSSDTIDERYHKITLSSKPNDDTYPFVRKLVEQWFSSSFMKGDEISSHNYINMCILELRARYPSLFKKLASEYKNEFTVEDSVSFFLNVLSDAREVLSVSEYVEEYELRADTDYKPSGFEKVLIEDAIEGYLSHIEEIARK